VTSAICPDSDISSFICKDAPFFIRAAPLFSALRRVPFTVDWMVIKVVVGKRPFRYTDAMNEKRAHIFQINASKGGVPKHGAHAAHVSGQGLTTDRQSDTKHHGGSDRALCLYSLERILALQGEGHPIFPGAVGENLTVAGLDWDRLQPGARLRLGPVLAEITSYTTPCKTVEAYFADGNFNRISQKKHPGWARVYARVLETGAVQVGDEVRLVTT
jgi:MOSC domain-containing protein YiiM